MRSSVPAQRDLVLVGGGHAHALVLRALAMKPVGGLRITLVSPAPLTPYSGMLPGLLAGHYRFEETHIDLVRLCQWAGVRFFADTVLGLDPQARRLHCAGRGDVSYDILSLDIGSQPELDSVPGAREHAIPVKPVAGLWSRWSALHQGEALAGQRVAIVGGGAGSVEVALAAAYRLRDAAPQITLYCGAPELLAGYGGGARRAVERQLAALGVGTACDHRVAAVESGVLRFAQGTQAPFDTLIWCTGAAPADWVAHSGLPVDERGFLAVRDTLQSTAQPEIFAAGDIATQVRHPRPKAGVYAVRQGPVLAHNLAAFACGTALREHRPQRRFLSLLSLGERSAVAERNGFSLRGAWVWGWKDRIDRRFMARFSELPARPMDRVRLRRDRTIADAGAARPSVPGAREQAPCGGCGAKVGADALGSVLDALRDKYGNAVASSEELDDAVPLSVEGVLLQSVDALRALVDDPWRMGRIAAQHALSDLYASGARPHSALALLALPFAAPAILRRDLHAVLDGALSIFAPAGCRLVGGHSMQGPELQVGFAVNGTLIGDAPLTGRSARPGDRLLLTRPLGGGALFAAHMQGHADGRDVEHALALMEAGNARAGAVALDSGASALTDVTGFGLAGHLLALLGDAQAAEVDAAALPVLPGAQEAMTRGIFSTLQADNERAFGKQVEAAPGVDAALLFDPQTGGGLLMSVAPERAAAALEALGGTGAGAALIGRVAAAAATSARIRLR